MKIMRISTPGREAMVDITDQLAEVTRMGHVTADAILAYTPHTTTGLTINEGADPDVCRDILAHLRALIPRDSGFRHAEGNSDAHIKASLFGSSVCIIIENGHLVLGRWQRVFLGEFDGPRSREIWVRFLS